MVPEAVGGPGRRGARLGPHGNKGRPKARGLEATLVDRQQRIIEALEVDDGRAFEVAVAGPAALLVAKLHKIAERIDIPSRRENKDALDILRLLQAVPTETIANGVRNLLGAEISAYKTCGAQSCLRALESAQTRRARWRLRHSTQLLESNLARQTL